MDEEIPEEVRDNGRHFWSCILEGVPALLDREEAKELQRHGLIEKYRELPGRGRYAGRWEATWTEKLQDMVRAMIQTENSILSAKKGARRR